MPFRPKVECSSGKDDGLVEILHDPKLLVPSYNKDRVQGCPDSWVFLWAKVNRFIKVPGRFEAV